MCWKVHTQSLKRWEMVCRFRCVGGGGEGKKWKNGYFLHQDPVQSTFLQMEYYMTSVKLGVLYGY